MMETVHLFLCVVAAGLYVIAIQNCVRALEILPEHAFDNRRGPTAKTAWNFTLYAWNLKKEADTDESGWIWGVIHTAIFLMLLSSLVFAMLNIWDAIRVWHDHEHSLIKMFAWRFAHILTAIAYIAAPAFAVLAARQSQVATKGSHHQ